VEMILKENFLIRSGVELACLQSERNVPGIESRAKSSGITFKKNLAHRPVVQPEVDLCLRAAVAF
jgi:hypothetical protein